MEKRLSLLAICFVVIYLLAAGLTVHSRLSQTERPVRIEGTGPQPGESEMMMAQLLLPMLIVLTVTVCFIVVRKRREAALDALEEPDKVTSEVTEDEHRQ